MKLGVIVTAILSAFILSQVQAAQGEICVHGNSGQLQDKGANASHHGWGIDYDVAGTGSWLQYSIPTEPGSKVKAIRVLFARDGARYKEGWIRHVHVYDGARLVKKFDDVYWGQGDQNKTLEKVASLDPPAQFQYAVGVSVLPETKVAGGLKAIVNMEFHSLCAIFAP